MARASASSISADMLLCWTPTNRLESSIIYSLTGRSRIGCQQTTGPSRSAGGGDEACCVQACCVLLQTVRRRRLTRFLSISTCPACARSLSLSLSLALSLSLSPSLLSLALSLALSLSLACAHTLLLFSIIMFADIVRFTLLEDIGDAVPGTHSQEYSLQRRYCVVHVLGR